MVAGIVGLGLMGGSLGLALKTSGLFSRIKGFDHNNEHQQMALKLGLVDAVVPFEKIKHCDVIFLAIPVEGIIATTKELLDISPKTTIIDLGSTKEKIVQSIPAAIRKNFVAAHPMTGTEKFGPEAAVKGLYKDKVVVLCDIQQSGESQRDMAQMIFERLGMKIVTMNAREHDIHAAFISHLPHAISYALANTVLSQEDPRSILLLAAGGFKDMSRLAKSSPNMWRDIFKQNRENLLASIKIFQRELDECERLLEREQWDELHEWMQKATTLHAIL